MARRRKRKRRPSEQKASGKKPELFNPAFGGLFSLKKKSDNTLQQPKKQEPPLQKGDPTETQCFLEAMSDVEPLSKGKNTLIRPPNLSIRPSHPAKNHDLEAMAHLSDLVSGNAEMDITFSDEYIEGSVLGVGRELMQRLKKGQFPIQDYVDLHGLTKKEAETNVRDFLIRSYRLGLRCVLVVHGRGLNSENHIPVLKERLPVWLNRGPEFCKFRIKKS